MKQKKTRAILAFVLAFLTMAQPLATPLNHAFAAEENTDSSLAYFVDCGDYELGI